MDVLSGLGGQIRDLLRIIIREALNKQVLVDSLTHLKSMAQTELYADKV